MAFHTQDFRPSNILLILVTNTPLICININELTKYVNSIKINLFSSNNPIRATAIADAWVVEIPYGERIKSRSMLISVVSLV
jgi:hypothetical protein